MRGFLLHFLLGLLHNKLHGYVLAFACHGCFVLLLVSCAATGPSSTVQCTVVNVQDAPIKFHGRWDTTQADAPVASWPGFAWETSFTGSSLQVIMTDASNYYNVWVDGHFHRVIGGQRCKKSAVTVADGLSLGTHHLRIQRRNISFAKPTIVHGFILEKNQK